MLANDTAQMAHTGIQKHKPKYSPRASKVIIRQTLPSMHSCMPSLREEFLSMPTLAAAVVHRTGERPYSPTQAVSSSTKRGSRGSGAHIVGSPLPHPCHSARNRNRGVFCMRLDRAANCALAAAVVKLLVAPSCAPEAVAASCSCCAWAPTAAPMPEVLKPLLEPSSQRLPLSALACPGRVALGSAEALVEEAAALFFAKGATFAAAVLKPLRTKIHMACDAK